ncbi:MAG: TAXI family TRAP transporter solute-binding subunit [Xenococcaceae cyanobacterium MO_234.B1]|nr:TAXI family TRAP transporter solute-binding subunit [Xenococcaceae cyanobacterium MO_234.B1]
MQNKLALPITLISIFMVFAFAWQWFREENRVHYLTIATGGKDGEYYAFARAFAQVIARHQPQIQIEVMETEGSLQNQEFLRAKKVQLALLQSDTPLDSSTQAIAVLFPEMFHLIATTKSNINSVSDLKGKRVALLPKGSGSYQLFWPLSKHYGLRSTDFEPVILPSEQAHLALRQGRVDALFQVISLGNPAITELLQRSDNQLVPIDQGAAIQLFQPALEPSKIPKGTYGGAIPIPAEDLPVVSVQALLVTHQDIDPSVIYEITRILFEARNELVKQDRQAAMIPKRDSIQELGLPFHPGAKKYYKLDEPSLILSFFVEYAEVMGLLLSITILCLSGIWQLKLWLQGKQKNRADFYNLEILKLINQIHSLKDLERLKIVRRQLFEILEKVVMDLDEDRISPESFQSFTFTWKVALNTIRHREMLLMNLRSPE